MRVFQSRSSYQSETHTPWWQAYIMAIIFTAGLIGIGLLRVTTGEELILEVIAVIVFYGLMLKWMHVHDPEIHSDSHNLEQFQITIIQQDRQPSPEVPEEQEIDTPIYSK